MNLPAGTYTVEATLVGTDAKTETELEVIAQSQSWWETTLIKGTYKGTEALEVRFVADVPIVP